MRDAMHMAAISEAAFNPATEDLRRDPAEYRMARLMAGTSHVCHAGPPAGAGTTAAQTAAMNANQTLQVNAQIRAAILNNAVEDIQQIYNQTITTPGSSNNVVQVPFRNVGLVKGFIVKCVAAFTASASANPTVTTFGPANILSNVTLFDLDNYQRINTPGWHLNVLGTLKEGFPHGAALLSTAFDAQVGYGSNFGASAITAPTDVPATGSATFYYWVPCSYSASDLRGAIYAGVVNATAYLQLTINPTPWIINTSDATLAIFTGASGSSTTISSITITVYQVYLDQLPRWSQGPQAGAPMLPPVDIATQYRLNATSLQGVTTGQDFPVPFSNFQQFLSLFIIYDQAGTLNGGTDLNYFALAAANTYQLFKVDPTTQAWRSRHKIMTDFPKGTYGFDFRNAPISTNQTGNMQLFLNAITAATGTTVFPAFESFALVNTVLGAASLPAS